MKKWKIVKLGDVLTESRIQNPKPNSKKRIRVKLNMGGVEKRPDTNDKLGATKYFLRKKGQFIYGTQNLHKGAFGIVGPDLDGFESSSDIPAFDASEECSAEWIFYFLKCDHFYLKLESIAKGVGSKRINAKQLFKLNIAVPPIKEQKEILNKIYELEEKLNTIKNEFDLQMRLLTRLRTMVLEDAFKGNLTKKWRDEHSKIEDAKILQDKIATDKIKIGIKPSVIQKSNTNDQEFSLPNSWTWSLYGELILDIEAGKSPFCEPQNANINQWGVIKLSAISWGTFIETENKTLPLNITPFVEKEIKAGDFILTRANTPELIARSVIVPENVRERLLLNDKTLRIKFSKFIDLQYVNFFNNSALARTYYLTVASGTSDSMKNISRGNILNQKIPLPPLEEQKAISEKVTHLLNNCRQLEEQIVQSKADAEVLFNSQLTQYFRNTELNPNLLELKSADVDNTLRLRGNSYITNINSSDMELDEILKTHGKMSAIDLWKMSKHENNIDAFYAELKILVETENKIVESAEKGFLEASHENN